MLRDVLTCQEVCFRASWNRRWVSMGEAASSEEAVVVLFLSSLVVVLCCPRPQGSPGIRPYGVTWNPANENTVGRPDVPRHYRRPEISPWLRLRFWPESVKSQGPGDGVPNSRNDVFRLCGKAAHPSQPIGVILIGRIPRAADARGVAHASPE